ncbi:hypothetical protein ACLI4R_17380 [Natrialbaceae archaeon A-chndr2]
MSDRVGTGEERFAVGDGHSYRSVALALEADQCWTRGGSVLDSRRISAGLESQNSRSIQTQKRERIAQRPKNGKIENKKMGTAYRV